MEKVITIKPQYVCNVKDFAPEGNLIEATISADLSLNLLLSEKPINYKKDDYFFNRIGKERHYFKIVNIYNGLIKAINIQPTHLNLYQVQQMPDKSWIGICCDTFWNQKNAVFINQNGKISGFFHAGQDQTDIQVSDNGNIWIGFDNQGIYGHTDLSCKKLVCLDSSGQELFNYRDDIEERFFDPNSWQECNYLEAFNVISDDEVWFYGDNCNHSIVQIKNFRIKKFFPYVSGYCSDELGIYHRWALMCGLRETKALFNFDTEETYPIYMVDENNDIIQNEWTKARKDTSYFQFENTFYKITIPEILDKAGLNA